MPAKRIFIAIDISDEARRRSTDHIDKMRSLSEGVRVSWERPGKLHLTLKFLGNVEDGLVADVSEAAASVAAGFPPFDIAVVGTGVFPRGSRPRVLWLGIGSEDGTLRKVASELEACLSQLGFEPETKPFSPHLTIARIREPQKAKRLADAHLQSQFVPVEFTVNELTVYESVLKPTGSVYAVVSRHPISSPSISRS